MSASGSYYPPPSFGPSHRPPTDEHAVTALIVGISALFVPFAPGLVAVFMGSAAKRNIRASEGTRSGLGIATAAQVIAVIAILFWALVVAGLIASGL